MIYEIESEIDQTEIVLSTLREKKENAQQRILGIDKELAKFSKIDKVALIDPSFSKQITNLTTSDIIVDVVFNSQYFIPVVYCRLHALYLNIHLFIAILQGVHRML